MLRLLVTVVAASVLAGGAAAGIDSGTITTVVGTGVTGLAGDGGSAIAAEIDHPRGIALAPDGGFVFADAFAEVVRRVWPDGTIRTIAGTGVVGFSGDGGPAVWARFDLPHGVAFTSTGTLLVADTLNERIRAVAPDGTITTAAGTGVPGFSGDGGPATQAEIFAPRGIAALPGGGFLIPDSDNQRIRLVSEDGIITTVAGNGIRGFSGDGGPSTQAALNEPFGVAPLPDGGFLIADEGNNRVRRVWPDGTITTVAGTGTAGFSGDDGAADAAMLDEPKALLVLPAYQGFLVADAANSRIRLVTVDLRRELTLVAPGSLRTRHGHPVALAFTIDAAATVRLEVKLGKKRVLVLSEQVASGTHSLRFGRDLRPGRYRVALSTSSIASRPAQKTLTLVVS